MDNSLFDTALSISVGVLSGVVTAVFLWIVRRFFMDTVLPFYQRSIYQGTDLTGTWGLESTELDGSKLSVDLELTQSAHKLSGFLTISLIESDDQRFSAKYICQGEYWEGYLTLLCRTSSRKRYSTGTLNLKLAAGAHSLQGAMALGHFVNEDVNVRVITLSRS